MRILVIEDEDTLRAQLVDRLRREGYAVDETGSGKEGEFFGVSGGGRGGRASVRGHGTVRGRGRRAGDRGIGHQQKYQLW